MAQTQPLPGAAFAYEIARGSLEDQLHRIEALDAKSGILLAAGGIFAGFLLSGRSVLTKAPEWLEATSGALLSLAVVCALLALLNQSYITAPRAQAVASFARRDELWLKWRFLGNLHMALEWNGRKLDRKIRFLTAAQVLLIATVGLDGGYFVLTTLKGG